MLWFALSRTFARSSQPKRNDARSVRETRAHRLIEIEKSKFATPRRTSPKTQSSNFNEQSTRARGRVESTAALAEVLGHGALIEPHARPRYSIVPFAWNVGDLSIGECVLVRPEKRQSRHQSSFENDEFARHRRLDDQRPRHVGARRRP
jgi:hypothetical protein